MDMEARYQCKADEIAEELYGKDFYDLLPDTRSAVYTQVVIDVDQEIIGGADYLREWIAERRWEAQYDRT